MFKFWEKKYFLWKKVVEFVYIYLRFKVLKNIRFFNKRNLEER